MNVIVMSHMFLVMSEAFALPVQYDFCTIRIFIQKRIFFADLSNMLVEIKNDPSTADNACVQYICRHSMRYVTICNMKAPAGRRMVDRETAYVLCRCT